MHSVGGFIPFTLSASSFPLLIQGVKIALEAGFREAWKSAIGCAGMKERLAVQY